MVQLSSGKAYILQNKKSLTVCDLSGANQRSVIGFLNKRSENQKWKIQQVDEGWTIQNVYNQKYLDIGGSLQDGTEVVAIDTDQPRKWDIRPDPNDDKACRIFVQRGSNLNVDLDQGNRENGTPVTVWSKWEGENQLWYFQDDLIGR